jgi:hypothetical protein
MQADTLKKKLDENTDAILFAVAHVSDAHEYEGLLSDFRRLTEIRAEQLIKDWSRGRQPVEFPQIVPLFVERKAIIDELIEVEGVDPSVYIDPEFLPRRSWLSTLVTGLGYLIRPSAYRSQ